MLIQPSHRNHFVLYFLIFQANFRNTHTYIAFILYYRRIKSSSLVRKTAILFSNKWMRIFWTQFLHSSNYTIAWRRSSDRFYAGKRNSVEWTLFLSRLCTNYMRSFEDFFLLLTNTIHICMHIQKLAIVWSLGEEKNYNCWKHWERASGKAVRKGHGHGQVMQTHRHTHTHRGVNRRC